MVKFITKFKIDQRYFFIIKSVLKNPRKKILKKVKFTHPYYDKIALENQNKLKKFKIKIILYFVEVIFIMAFMKME